MINEIVSQIDCENSGPKEAKESIELRQSTHSVGNPYASVVGNILA